jgi:hypothetical protein
MDNPIDTTLSTLHKELEVIISSIAVKHTI